jgi:hypothetical protein
MNDAEPAAAVSNAAADSSGKTVTVTVINSSPIFLTLAGAILAAGHWQQPPPPIGWSLKPGGTMTAVNAADSAFSPVSGTLTFNPADGGSLTMSWIWPDNQGLTAVGAAYSSSLTMNYSTYNDLSNNGTVQFVVIPV